MITFHPDPDSGNPHNIIQKYFWVRIGLRAGCELRGTTGGAALILGVMRHHILVAVDGRQRCMAPPRSLVMIPPHSPFSLRSRNELKLLGFGCNGDCIDPARLQTGAETAILQPIPMHTELENHLLLADLYLNMPGDQAANLEMQRRKVFISLLANYPDATVAGFFSPLLETLPLCGDKTNRPELFE